MRDIRDSHLFTSWRIFGEDIRDSHLFTSWLSSLFKVCSPSCVCAWLGRRQALAVDPPAPRGAVASKTRASCHSPRLGGGNGANASTVVGPRAEPGAIGGVAANDQRLSAAIITSHGGAEKGGESAQGGGGSNHNGSGDDPSLTAALAQMGFDSVDEYQDWLIDASESEAFASASLLLELLEAQP